jgi:hypothetical protein
MVPPKDRLALKVGVPNKTQKNKTKTIVFKLVLHTTNLSKKGKKIVHTNIVHVVMIFTCYNIVYQLDFKKKYLKF